MIFVATAIDYQISENSFNYDRKFKDNTSTCRVVSVATAIDDQINAKLSMHNCGRVFSISENFSFGSLPL